MDGVVTVVRPHRFTVAEYHRMAEAGILDEDSRVELIRGQIVDLVDRVVEVYRQARNGRYVDVGRVRPGDVLDIALLSGAALAVAELFPVLTGIALTVE
ncbi:MAG TPA: hypothetical protein VGG99_04885 [Acetobacteraceae bacterium]|jgi:Uma2 family endonuclease